ncbi:MAG: hypothetical protein BHV75_11460 [Bacteroides oleiciplenus]|uniref:Uncharacterized protein n=1 Tax=Bacteroides stercorirosoris TaxID=871324 RepID=A0A1M6GBG3_9BACE|nr:hypothetical protein [Bacteroides stercorirosoris]OKZ09771.1 MAG: hypothetical protein BHV75_11460 [Bacteroides oleiciplenus]SHJ07247.1 hypothetical protein SAMN05444350_114104 [Bacteroides stercorirosoris]
MDIILFISQFLYRIRYWLLWGTLFVTGLVIYFTQFLPYSYTVESSLYAGITNSTSIDGAAINYSAVNSTFDNLINIAKARGTLQKVSLRLLANSYTYGEEWKDNQYIQAKHYRQLLQMTPKEVLSLIDRKDAEKTLANLTAYRKESSSNFVYAMFNRPVAFYSAMALDEISIKRAGNSDILDIVYTSADPGITQKTVSILIDELIKAYEILRFKSTNDVIAYFERQVRLTKEALSKEEDDLMNYNVSERVINYPEETKALAGTRYEVEDRLEEAERIYEGAVALRDMLEGKMDIRAQIIRNNTNLLNELDKVSTLNQSIMEREIYTTDKNQLTDQKLQKEREALKKAENQISHISDNLNEFSFSKEGVGIQSMVEEWLIACINEAKAKAELQVLKKRQDNIFEQYVHMSPIGTQVNRKQRAISIAEDNYRTQLKGLADANLRLKNIEMSTSNLQMVAPPDFPLTDNGRKRILYILIAFIGSIIFITTYFLLIEILDRTLRDPLRSKRLSGLPVIAAFNGVNNLKYRGFLKACNRIAAAYCCRKLDKYMKPGQPAVISLLSINPGEGKSFLAKYFIEHWKSEGVRVRLVQHGIDFESDSKNYVQAEQISDFWKLNEAEQIPDIILVEYPAIQESSVPLSVLQKSDAVLLIANARRLWRNSDNTTLYPIKECLENVPFSLYLNNADRDVVESFTGELPPKMPIHSFFSRLAQLGLTSQKAAVK